MPITKRKKRKILKPDEISKVLNPRQILFTELYAFDKDCFGNATNAYMRAYDLKDNQRKNARQLGYHLLTNSYIRDYLNHLLEARFNNEVIDRRHSQLINQDKNLVVALGAIQEYNKIKKRVEESPIGKIEFSWKGDNRPKKNTIISETDTQKDELEEKPKTPKGKFVIEINKK